MGWAVLLFHDIIPESWRSFEDDIVVFAAAVAGLFALYRTLIRPVLRRVDRWLDTREAILNLPDRFAQHLVEAKHRDELIEKLAELIEEEHDDRHPDHDHSSKETNGPDP